MKLPAVVAGFLLAAMPLQAFASECPKPKESNGMTFNWIFDNFYIAASMNDAPFVECKRRTSGKIMEEGYLIVEYKCPTFSLIHKDLSTASKLRRLDGYSTGNSIFDEEYYVIDKNGIRWDIWQDGGLVGLGKKPSIENQVIVNVDVCTEIKEITATSDGINLILRELTNYELMKSKKKTPQF